MKKVLALAALAVLAVPVAFADTTVESSTVSEPGSGTSSSTTVINKQDNPAPAPVIVAPASAPVVQKTKFKKEKHGLFGKTKVKGETTTVTP